MRTLLLLAILLVVPLWAQKGGDNPFAELETNIAKENNDPSNSAHNFVEEISSQKQGMGMNLLTRFLADVILLNIG